MLEWCDEVGEVSLIQRDLVGGYLLEYVEQISQIDLMKLHLVKKIKRKSNLKVNQV